MRLKNARRELSRKKIQTSNKMNNNISAVSLYKDMKGGSAQINPLSDYFQESENDMKTKPIKSESTGYNLGYGIQYYEFDKTDTYDYTKPVTYDYTKEN
jgi:hypothetical protein